MSVRVMVVEDDPELSDVLAEYLGRQGIGVLSADTGKAALELLRRSAESLRNANRLDDYLRVAERIAALEPADVVLEGLERAFAPAG